jgi:hypothetical protein
MIRLADKRLPIGYSRFFINRAGGWRTRFSSLVSWTIMTSRGSRIPSLDEDEHEHDQETMRDRGSACAGEDPEIG